MLNKFRELRALNAFAKKQSVGMQRKLMLYWVSMILVVFAAVILLLSIAGAFSQNDEQLHEVMELQLKNTRQLQRSLCNFECHGQYHPGGGRPLQKRAPPALHQPQRQ